MAKMGKWIGGFLGLITAGPLGALAGFVLGAIFDSSVDAVNANGGEAFMRNSMSTRASAIRSASPCSCWLPISSKQTAK